MRPPGRYVSGLTMQTLRGLLIFFLVNNKLKGAVCSTFTDLQDYTDTL